jgi:hypothetical protein
VADRSDPAPSMEIWRVDSGCGGAEAPTPIARSPQTQSGVRLNTGQGQTLIPRKRLLKEKRATTLKGLTLR